MAIAGIVISAPRHRLTQVRELVRLVPGVLDVQFVDGQPRLAVVLESPSQTLQKDLEGLRALPDVLELDVAYANYEDDLDSDGHMACPAHQPRQNGTAREPNRSGRP